MPKKSIFRQPGARTYQLVHRSQRDPLINDPDAPQHVLKEFERENLKKGKSRADLEENLTLDDLNQPKNAGEASLYGVYYDDTKYDYMQHLRTVGANDGADSILLEAPTKPRTSKKTKDFDFIPKEALPSLVEEDAGRVYERQQAIPSSIAGFQPDMNPHLRQTLEALEDEAFVEDAADDDFFAELVAGGEREQDEEPEFDFAEEGIPDSLDEKGTTEEDEELEEAETWQERFAQFKKAQQKRKVDYGSVLDEASEGGDTIGKLPSLSVLGAKKRRKKGTSDASGYSMSSSSMFRNEGLTTLDERFEKFEREFAEDDMPDVDEIDAQIDALSDSDQEPALITTRADFEAVLDEFLEQELVGNKLLSSMPGSTPMDKLQTLRRELSAAENADDERRRREALLDREDVEDRPVPMPVDLDEKEDRWDCETILTTYSNLENHPRVLRLLERKEKTKKIILDKKTGLPSIAEDSNAMPQLGENSEEIDRPVKVTVKRAKDESKEDKKARKAAVKEEKQNRRVEKKANQETFAQERKAQKKAMSQRERAGVLKL